VNALNARQNLAKGIGWNLIEAKPEAGNLLQKGKHFSILENGDERIYCLDCFPSLTGQEQSLLHDAAELFQKSTRSQNRDDLKEFFKSYCIQNLVLLEKKQVEYLLLLLEKQLFGFGLLDFFLEDKELEEIAVIGLGKGKPVHVFHSRFGWLATNAFFSSHQEVKNLVNRMSRAIGRRLSMNSPVLNATLPGGSRLSAAINPISLSGPSLTIRKFGKEPFSPAALSVCGLCFTHPSIPSVCALKEGSAFNANGLKIASSIFIDTWPSWPQEWLG